jgi:hypothetical protein
MYAWYDGAWWSWVSYSDESWFMHDVAAATYVLTIMFQFTVYTADARCAVQLCSYLHALLGLAV